MTSCRKFSHQVGSTLLAIALAGAIAVAPRALAQEGEGGEAAAAAAAQTHWIHQGPAGRGGGPVTADMLRRAPADPSSWLHFGGNYGTWRHSPIQKLTPASLADLRVAWMLPTGVPVQLEVSPIVYDGILYATASQNRLFAVDAVTGKILWRYDHQQPKDLRICCGPVNRGAAIAGDTVLMATLDARLIAFDRKSGKIVWNTEIAPYERGLSATSAPLVVGDVAVIGIGGGEYGVRGFFDGYDWKTGERRWRHFTVPVEGEPGVETWAGDSWKSGGAPTWVSGSYDPATDTLFWAAGNPSPDWNGDLRQGDNLYSDSVLAIDPKTGKRKWHFQFTPHDVWDYDGNSELWLVDVEIGGQKIPALAQANRNGYFYLLDRRDGKFLFAQQYADQVNWGTIDAKGRPKVNPRMVPADENETPERVCPGLAGGHQGSYNGAFNPDLGLAFVPVIESCMQFKKGIVVFVEGVPFMGGEPVGVDAAEGKAYGHLSAIDVATGKEKWRYKDPYPMMAGVLSTAGGAVITGNMEGHILGFDAATGKETWRFNAGSTIRSHPVAYEIDGRVFVAVGVGGGGVVEAIVGKPSIVPDAGDLLVFELPSASR
jgi:alcohol dehydrogenase (cytochrome c)